MPRKPPSIEGFRGLSDQVFVRDGDKNAETATSSSSNSTDPDIVAVYGWGDGLPQHVAKYAEGYRTLFPRAKQVVVLSPIAKAMFTSRAQRRAHMTPVVNHIFGSPDAVNSGGGGGGGESKASLDSSSTNSSSSGGGGIAQGGSSSKILVHAMSNTGAINFAATLDAYLARFRAAMPHALLVTDSTPGGTDLTWANLKRWSRAMALGTAKWFPWPFAATQCVWALFLLLNTLYLWVRRRRHAGAWSRAAVNEERFAARGARRLYMYSAEDDLIGYEDIQEHAVEARRLGYEVEEKVFVGSGHVGHMRMHPEEYWAAIKESWERGQ